MSCDATPGCTLHENPSPAYPVHMLDARQPPSRSGLARQRYRLRRQNDPDHERERALGQARILQAQIEPHFLFNTLAHVSALVRSDPPRAEVLLEHLSTFLRSSLSRSREARGTLGEELELVSDYLQIVGIRLGTRLRWSIDADDEILQHGFPIMLLQPIVENAIRHGIEPKRGGGNIRISARRTGRQLLLQVCDDGVGLSPDMRPGVGLDNIRQRLHAHYGTGGRLELRNNPDGGVTVDLELPCHERTTIADCPDCG